MKSKRINYNIIERIIGMEFEMARDICLFNGYILGGNVRFWSISYKLNEYNKIIKACIN
jgi:prephenate dehydrogenase